MAINTAARQGVTYFIGTEVENTIMKGQKTLFVVGVQPVEDVVKIALKHNITHCYLGTSQSFHPQNPYEWDSWAEMIKGLLLKDYWVTVDFDVQYAREFHDQVDWSIYHKFIPMISVKIPNISRYNYHTTLKIDDNTWGDTNPGVWCHPLNELMTRDVYTDWKDYVGDEPVDIDESLFLTEENDE